MNRIARFALTHPSKGLLNCCRGTLAFLAGAVSPAFGAITLNIDLGTDEIWFSGSDSGVGYNAFYLLWSPDGEFPTQLEVFEDRLGAPSDFTYTRTSGDQPRIDAGSFIDGEIYFLGQYLSEEDFLLEAVGNRYSYSSSLNETERELLESLDSLISVGPSTFADIEIVVTSPAAVPEPGTWALIVGFPAILLAGIRRRQALRHG